MMKTPILSFALIIFATMGHLSCENPSGPSGDGIPLELRVLGVVGATKTYNFTVAEFIQGTQTPAIVPPESLRPFLQFPESLYSRGIFAYGQATHRCEFAQDTFRVIQSDQGFNLFSIIYNAFRHQTTDGAYSGFYTAKYLLVNGREVYQVFEAYRDLIFELPLRVGIVYTSTYSGAVTSVAALDTIATLAGTFPAFRVEVAGRWSPGSHATYWVSPEIGPIISEYHFYHAGSYPWDPGRDVQVHQIQRLELVGIN